MTNETWIALIGMASLALGFIGGLACIVSMIWHADLALKIAGTVTATALFCLVAALFVQTAVDRSPHPAPQDSEAVKP